MASEEKEMGKEIAAEKFHMGNARSRKKKQKRKGNGGNGHGKEKEN